MKYAESAILMFFLLLLMTPSVSQAQIKFGIRAGLNATNISFEKMPNRSERYGYHIGIFSDVTVKPDYMSLQPELSFSIKGAGFEPPSGKQTLNMNYLDFFLPVAFKMSLFDIQVGPFASYLISKPDYTIFNENKVIIDAFKKVDIGLTAGLSVNINRLMIGARYNQGFVDVAKDNSRPFLGSGKNAVGQVSLGYKF